ncbi:MAG: glycosyltransferase [Bacteroidetes bacterium]|nr:glycosyltransferase [Bacteroidota bacterium]
MSKKFTLIIPTKNRLSELKYSLEKLSYLLNLEQVHVIICVDGSTDGTVEFLSEFYPSIELIVNENSRGIHYTRNMLMNNVKTPYIISIDDDAHFLTENILDLVENYFLENKTVGLLSFRAYWNKEEPKNVLSDDKPIRVKGFGAVGFAMQTQAWKSIPNFPEWFVFYGEEDFAAFHLFKSGWEIHYFPAVLVHHRVNLKARKREIDYRLRLRRSLRSGWYLYFLFYPWALIPRKLAYTLWIQIKLKVLKGDWRAGIAILQAIGDLFFNIHNLIKNRTPLSKVEFFKFQSLTREKLFWNDNTINKTN